MAQTDGAVPQSTNIYPSPPLFYNLYDTDEYTTFNEQYGAQLDAALHTTDVAAALSALYADVSVEYHKYLPPMVPEKYMRFGEQHTAVKYTTDKYINASQLFNTLPSNIPWLYTDSSVQTKTEQADADSVVDVYKPSYTPYTHVLRSCINDCMQHYLTALNVLVGNELPADVDIDIIKQSKPLYIGNQTTRNAYYIEHILTQMTAISFNFTARCNQLRMYQAKATVIELQRKQLSDIRAQKVQLQQLIEQCSSVLSKHNIQYVNDGDVVPVPPRIDTDQSTPMDTVELTAAQAAEKVDVEHQIIVTDSSEPFAAAQTAMKHLLDTL